MRRLPRVNDSLLVRTDFSDNRAWAEICAEARRVSEDGLMAFLVPVNDRTYDGASWQAVLDAVPANEMGAAVLFIADTEAMTLPGHPVLAVSRLAGDGSPFRCVTAELACLETNLNLAKLGWADFVSQVGADGVFRGWLPFVSWLVRCSQLTIRAGQPSSEPMPARSRANCGRALARSAGPATSGTSQRVAAGATLNTS